MQQVTGPFLFYAWGVDVTIMTALSNFALEHSTPTKVTMKKVKKFLDYAASQEDAVITYKESDMVLAVHSDASFWVKKRIGEETVGITSFQGMNHSHKLWSCIKHIENN